jgi:signal transduction histidine kinase
MTVFSHELRNSLSAIRSATRILRMETSSGPPAVTARMLIERHGGCVAVASAGLGHGSEFTVRLPTPTG